MLCYVMLCYVMLCYVMLCYVMLCYVMLCYVMLCKVAIAKHHVISKSEPKWRQNLKVKNTLPLHDYFIYMCHCALKNEVYNSRCYSGYELFFTAILSWEWTRLIVRIPGGGLKCYARILRTF